MNINEDLLVKLLTELKGQKEQITYCDWGTSRWHQLYFNFAKMTATALTENLKQATKDGTYTSAIRETQV